MTLSDAFDDDVFESIVDGHLGHDDEHFNAIFDLQFDQVPSSESAPAAIDCKCKANKDSRILAEKAAIKVLTEEALTISDEIRSSYSATIIYSSTLRSTLTTSFKTILGTVQADLPQVFAGLSPLLPYYQKATEVQTIYYVLYKAAHALGEVKKDIMLATIYHDQQLLSQVCTLEASSRIKPSGQKKRPPSSQQ